MLRNRYQHHDFRQEFPPMRVPSPEAIYTPPRDQLDPKDERLLDLSKEVGRLQGVNDLLQEDNVRLEQEVEQAKKEMSRLRERNAKLEEEATSERAAERSAASVIDEFIEELKNRSNARKEQ